MKCDNSIETPIASYRLSWVKCWCILMLGFFSVVQSQIYVSDDALFHIDSDKNLDSLDSEQQSSAEIYITSGTTITNLEHSGKYEVIAIEEPEINNLGKNIALKEAQEVVLTHSKAEKKQIPKVPSRNSFAFSTQSNSDFSFAEFSKTAVTLLPGSPFSAKIIAIFSKNNLNTIHFLQERSDVFLYSDSFFSNSHSSNFFARPPPMFS